MARDNAAPERQAARRERLRTQPLPPMAADIESARNWLLDRRIEEVECLIPDMSGIARGKILPSEKFITRWADRALSISETIFIQTVTGDYAQEAVTSGTDIDIYLVPDVDSIRRVPWYNEPTAQVICDVFYSNGATVDIAPRQVLRRVLKLYADQGWEPQVAPELEFFLTAVNHDPDYPLVPPVGRSGRQETGRQAFGVDAVNEFDPLFEDIYDFCEDQGIDIDALTHEAGAAQMEINFDHGLALEQADQAFLFKRTVREAALRHKVYATFMAKPMQREPGSSMHIHQSVVDQATGRNLFGAEDGGDTKLFMHHIGGLQRYLPAAMPLFAPNVNSYRRLVPGLAAPINLHWGRDNRTVGLRVPLSSPEGRRVENRLAGADCNPYLAIAASLACGYLGMLEGIEPTRIQDGYAYKLARGLPRQLPDAMEKLAAAKPLREVLGDDFVEVFIAVKDTEWQEYFNVISSWERENLLLNV